MEVRKMITSTSNQRVKELSQIQKKSKIRSREGIFIAEGIRMVRETPHERLVGLYFSESFEKKYGKEKVKIFFNKLWCESLNELRETNKNRE